ncbi:MAG: hypothetical protein IE913_04945 [Halothiobacillus sp.]|nr:hypothetical protein [Paracoccaceae bacterium]MBD3815790.1 hypothetical protein [Halothiobacillus sp.]
MASDLFTFICEYKGGTYVSQVRASDHERAMIEWAALLRREQPIESMSEAIAQAVSDGQNNPVLLTGLSDVWCWSATVADELALTHFVHSGKP